MWRYGHTRRPGPGAGYHQEEVPVTTDGGHPHLVSVQNKRVWWCPHIGKYRYILIQNEVKSTFLKYFRISPNPGQMAELSVHLFTTSSQMHSTSGLSEQNLLQIGKRTLSLHSQLERNLLEFPTSWRQKTCQEWWRKGEWIPRWFSPTSRKFTECATNCNRQPLSQLIQDSEPRMMLISKDILDKTIQMTAAKCSWSVKSEHASAEIVSWRLQGSYFGYFTLDICCLLKAVIFVSLTRIDLT